MNFSSIILSGEANTLKDFVAAELARRSVGATTIANLTSGKLADDAWWESVRVNLAKIISTTGAEVVGGEKISIAKRDKLRDYAVSTYNTTVPVNTST